jgi:amino acid adenylation domain-containing protein
MDLFQSSFLSSAKEYPNNIALHTTEQGQEIQFTYHKLLKVCSAWAEKITKCNILNQPVAIYGGRQWQMYAGILAILATKSPYVPLNNKQPCERNSKILAQINSKVLLVAEGENPSELIGLTDHPLIVLYLGQDHPEWISNFQINQSDKSQTVIPESVNLDQDLQSLKHRLFRINDVNINTFNDIYNERRVNEERPNNKYEFSIKNKVDDYAYILFTSGTTGTPKGIAVSQKNIISHLKRLNSLLKLHPTDKVSQFFELSFDLSIHDMFSCWSKGATLCVIPSQQLMCPLAYIKQHEISVFSAVASLLSFMDKLSQLTPEQLPHLRVSCFGGEKLLTQQAIKWQKSAHNSRVINIYGPTECTITAMSYELTKESALQSTSVPIGKALPGLSAILVANNEIVIRPNTLAELYIGGDQLVDGYWQDEIKTNQSFVTNGFCMKSSLNSKLLNEQKLYKTGDICYYDENNQMVFHGRNDHQFKVSGHRIEAADIESVVVEFDESITWAVIQLLPVDEHTDQPRIAAFVELRNDHAINNLTKKTTVNSKTLRQYCLTKLPFYMVPDQFVFSEKLPRNISGKVDVKQLINEMKIHSTTRKI